MYRVQFGQSLGEDKVIPLLPWLSPLYVLFTRSRLQSDKWLWFVSYCAQSFVRPISDLFIRTNRNTARLIASSPHGASHNKPHTSGGFSVRASCSASAPGPLVSPLAPQERERLTDISERVRSIQWGNQCPLLWTSLSWESLDWQRRNSRSKLNGTTKLT